MKAWEKNVRTVVPYVPGEQPNQIGMIKLNTNENPYPPAPGVQEAIKSLDDKKMRLYPDPTADLLVSELADFYPGYHLFFLRCMGGCISHSV